MTQRKRQKKGDAHYVNNKEFTLALDSYSRECKKCEEQDIDKPIMSDYLALSIMKMARRLASTPRFSGYSYRDEMIQNAILAAVKYAHRFNGDKFDNGFAYVTQILFSHMVITIKNEKKKYITNLKMIQEMEAEFIDNPEFQYADQHAKSIADQKLQDMEVSKTGDDEKARGGFRLRTGYTKEARAAYTGGTPLVREEEDEDSDTW